MDESGKKVTTDLLKPEENPLPTIYEEPLKVDYQELSNLACCLDVVTTVIASYDKWDTATLTAALLEGARYNGADLEDLATDCAAPADVKPTQKVMKADAICAALSAASEVLIRQLLLALNEQHTIKARRI